MTYLVLTYKLYIVSNTYHTPEHYVCKWIVDGTSIEGKSGSKVFMSVAEIYIQSAPNNSNEIYTFMCLGRAGRIGQC